MEQKRWKVVVALVDGPQIVGVVEAQTEEDALFEASVYLSEVLGFDIEEGDFWVIPDGGDDNELLEP